MTELHAEPARFEGEKTPSAPENAEHIESTKIVFKTTGARVSWSADKTELHLNTSLFPSSEHARREALQQVAKQTGLKRALHTNPTRVLEATQGSKTDWETIFRWQGLSQLKENGAAAFHELAPAGNQSFKQEFLAALDSYVATGHFPAELSPPVQQALHKIPKFKGHSLIDYIASGRYLRFDGQNFQKFIQPIVDELTQEDQQTGQSQKFEYHPPQTQDLSASKEPIQESDITVKVTPFYGGYYREQVAHYDHAAGQIVNEAGKTQRWIIEELPEDEKIWKTRRTYTGFFSAEPGESKILIKLPYGAMPVPETLKSSRIFQLERDESGVVYLGLRDGMSQSFSKPEPFSFDFVLWEDEATQIRDELTDGEVRSQLKSKGGSLDPETQTFLDDLVAQTWQTPVQKAREIVKYIRKKFRYPADASEIAQIDAQYQSAGDALWTTMMETGVAHCYWANIFANELCHRLSIFARIATGPYVAGKDPRFDFAIVEGKGLDKHAWGEAWQRDAHRQSHFAVFCQYLSGSAGRLSQTDAPSAGLSALCR